MKIQNLALSMLIAALPFGAFAQGTADTSSTSTTSTSEVKKDVGASDLKDVDQEITNAKLRAESGSKKKFSFRSSFSFEGGNLQRPLAGDRPVLGGAQNEPRNTRLTGALGMKYRVTDHDNISARVGVNWLRPFGGDLVDASTGDRMNKTEISDPYITYEHTGKLGEFQSILGMSVTATTALESREAHQVSILNPSWTLMYAFKNGIELGGILDLNLSIYDQATTAAVDRREHYQIGLYPMLEYAFNDKVSFRTVFRYSTYLSTRANPDTYRQAMNTQSMGIGVAVSRDFYVYPNVQFDPGHMYSEFTTWGVQTNLNL